MLISQNASLILVVMMFGVGTDYCLLLVSRYREELARVGPGLASNLITHSRQTQSTFEQDLRGHRTLFAQKAQQQMFGSDVAVLQAI